jgi:hypothetical protein
MNKFQLTQLLSIHIITIRGFSLSLVLKNPMMGVMHNQTQAWGFNSGTIEQLFNHNSQGLGY